MDSIDSSSKNYSFIFISIVAALAGILFGYDTGVISGAILFISQQFQLTPWTNGVVVAAVLVGAALGALISGRITDYFGRKPTLIVVAVIFILSSIGAAIAQYIYTLILARVVIGIAIGIASYVAPLYISEISPPKHRGAMVSLNQFAISIGILTSYIVDYSFAEVLQGWRWMFATGAVPGVALLIGMFILPYSPRWKIAKSKPDDALSILKKIRGKGADVLSELNDIKESMNVEKAPWHAIFSKKIRPVLIIGAGLAIIQQVTGINTILYYAPTIFTMTGFQGPVSAILASFGIGTIFVLFTLLSLFLIDTLGRRPLLLTGLVGMCIGLLLLAWVFYLHTDSPSFLMRAVALASMLFYIASFAISLGPIMWLMIAEIYPLPVRGLGASFATMVNWISNMLVALTFLSLTVWLTVSGTFLLYFGFGILGLIFIYMMVPETKSVTLEQIEKNLYAGLPARKLGQ